jgi:DNA-binding NtrC family response regulator
MMTSGHHNQRESSGRVFVIDDEPKALKNLRRILEKDGHRVSTFTNPLRALQRLEEEPCDLIISDVKMPYMDGLTLLNRAKSLVPDIGVILITGYASLDGAVEATKLGAYHYLAKPFTPQQVREVTKQALKEKFLRDQSLSRVPGQGTLSQEPLIIGESPKMGQVAEVIRQIAPTECNVLITGESGTGRGPSGPLTVAHSAKNSSPMSCSATKKRPIPERPAGNRDSLSRLTEGHSSWMRSAICPSLCR